MLQQFVQAYDFVVRKVAHEWIAGAGKADQATNQSEGILFFAGGCDEGIAQRLEVVLPLLIERV